jgi:hypothetical protein
MGRIGNVVNALFVWSVILLFSDGGVAGTIVCPVCGERFDDKVEVCPNDGTDLRLLKRKDSGEKEAEAHTDSSSSDPKAAPASPTEGGEKKEEPLRFKRHDQGGERKIVPSKENGGYSDRQSRLPGDTRVGNVVKPKKPLHKSTLTPPPKRSDKQVLAAFERERRSSWEERESIRLRESHIKSDRASTHRKLLGSMAAPLTSLGGRIFWLREGRQPGPVGATEIDINVIRYYIRAGFSTLVGIRTLKVRNELVFLESLSAGLQWPGRFSPFVVANGGIGILATNRFGVDQVYLFSAVGASVGIDAWVHPWLAVTPSFGYLRCVVRDIYWHTITFRVAIGF